MYSFCNYLSSTHGKKIFTVTTLALLWPRKNVTAGKGVPSYSPKEKPEETEI